MSLPDGVICRRDEWDIGFTSRRGAETLGGQTQAVATGADKWLATLAVRVPQTAVSAYRGWRAARRGVLVADTIGPCTDLCPFAAPTSGTTAAVWSDGAAWDDGGVYAYGGTAASVRDAAGKGAREMQIDAPDQGDEWQSGRFFGVGGYLYQIVRPIRAHGNGGRYEIAPPLRAAIAAGASFDATPTARMMLADPDQGRIASTFEHYDDTVIELVEDVA